MTTSEPDLSVHEQVWNAADPTGQTRSMINAAIHSGPGLEWMTRLGLVIEADWRQLASVSAGYRRTLDGIEAAMVTLVPRGWAIMVMHSESIERAVRLVNAGRGAEADAQLANQWEAEGSWRTKQTCDRVRVMGALDPDLQPLFENRARLLWLAKQHHEAGRYDASIPLLQAQLEGIVMDVTGGKKFFTRGTEKADLVDPTKLMSIEAGLAALQATYGAGVKQTQMEGSLSRHGVAHGRELAYDTRVNSAKTWSVMHALAEWALPKARVLVGQRKLARQMQSAGSDSVDATGKRVDDREFFETREMLRVLSTSATTRHRRHAHFPVDLVGAVYSKQDFVKRGLPPEHGVYQDVRGDNQGVMYWRETVSGWVLGLSTQFENGEYSERYFSASSSPESFTDSRWSPQWEPPPDWV
ncbi:hypothetical protein GCM10028820_34590 [Tessaracoccus terricola]